MSNSQASHPPIHIILEYNPSPDFQGDAAKTIEKHQEVLDRKRVGYGNPSVLWPKISRTGRSNLRDKDIPRINKLVKDNGFETHLYMYAPEHKRFARRLDVGLLKKHLHGKRSSS